MVAYKQPPNLKSVLCRAQLPKNTHPKRKLIGMKNCSKQCNICPYILKTNKVTSLESALAIVKNMENVAEACVWNPSAEEVEEYKKGYENIHYKIREDHLKKYYNRYFWVLDNIC